MSDFQLEPVYQHTNNLPMYSSNDPPMYSQTYSLVSPQTYSLVPPQTYALIPPQMYSPTLHQNGAVPLTAITADPPQPHWTCPKICAATLGICVIIGIVIGVGYLAFCSWCNHSNTTFEYCKCDQFNIKTPDAHVCYLNRNDTQMTCTMDTGYFVCNASTNDCPINF